MNEKTLFKLISYKTLMNAKIRTNLTARVVVFIFLILLIHCGRKQSLTDNLV